MKIVKQALDNSVILLEITGEVTMGESAEELALELRQILDDPAVEGVVLNLENINYVDSTGLGEVVGYLGRFADKGKRLKLVRPNLVLRKLLSLTHLDEVIKVYETEEEALEDLVG